MCGIAGVWRFDSAPRLKDAVAVVEMLEAERHRGPDDWGLLVPAPLADLPALRSLLSARGLSGEHLQAYDGPGAPGGVLGARRLAVVDPSPRGRMPMASPDGRCFIVHNGEVYNFRALREELGPAPAWRSGSDTEVVLRAWGRWGPEAVPRLRGMFAVGVLETGPARRLVLARDRLGIKPLYYHQDRERLVFASEVRALLRSGLVPPEASPEAAARFLQFGCVPGPGTTVRDVLSLPPGHLLTAEGRPAAPARYWSLAPSGGHGDGPPPARSAEAAAAIRARLEEVVELHLVADRPLSIFLSGGVDSSALVALAARVSRRPPVTLSVGFAEPDHSELGWAREVAARYGTDHHEVLVGARDLMDALPGFLEAMDQPTADGVNTYLVALAARRRGLTVALSGIGADEVFWGYGHLRRAGRLALARRVASVVPSGVRRRLLGAAARAAPGRGVAGGEKLLYLAEPSAAGVYATLRSLFTPDRVGDLLGAGPADVGAAPSGWPVVDASPLADAVARLEMAHYLPNQLLRDADVMGMAHSLEIRVPYLDHLLVESVGALPARWKRSGRTPKPLLVGALGPDLPRAVWDRPKMGFTLPFATWLAGESRELHARSRECKLLQPRAVDAVWDDFRAGRLHWSRPWALVALAGFEAARGGGP